MTKRQANMGVTEYGIRVAKNGEFLRDSEAFLAKMSTVRKGQYKGLNLTIKFLKEVNLDITDGCARITHEYDVKRMLFGLSVKLPEYFIYTDTNGLDCLTVK